MDSSAPRQVSNASAIIVVLAAWCACALFEICAFGQEQAQPLEELSAEPNFDQVLSLWERIKMARASGNDAEVSDLERELLTSIRRHPDDLRAVPLLREIADRQLAAVERGVISDDPALQAVFSCTNVLGICYAGSRTVVVQGMVAEASRNYADAIAVILRNESYSSDEVRELEMGLVRAAEFIRNHYSLDSNVSTGTRTETAVPVLMVPVPFFDKFVEPWLSQLEPIMALTDWALPYESAGTPQERFLRQRESRTERFTSPYYRGRQSLRRLYVYEVIAAKPALAQAVAIVNMADWDLLFDRNGLAVEGYALALRMLERAGVADASAAELFAPAVPVVLPSFEPNPLARDRTLPSASHIDVAFEITKFGRARAIEILDAVSTTDAAQADLIALLKGRRFRPRLTNGELVDSPTVMVRYYVPLAENAE